MLSEDHSICFKFSVEKIDNSKFNDINLNDSLKDFISLFSLFDDFECSENSGIFSISDSRNKADFILSDPVLMGNYKVPSDFFERINSAPVVAEFDLDTETLKKIRTSLGVFKNSDCVSFNSGSNLVPSVALEINFSYCWYKDMNSFNSLVEASPSESLSYIEYNLSSNSSNVLNCDSSTILSMIGLSLDDVPFKSTPFSKI